MENVLKSKLSDGWTSGRSTVRVSMQKHSGIDHLNLIAGD